MDSKRVIEQLLGLVRSEEVAECEAGARKWYRSSESSVLG
jgi:hypothetical protein